MNYGIETVRYRELFIWANLRSKYKAKKSLNEFKTKTNKKKTKKLRVETPLQICKNTFKPKICLINLLPKNLEDNATRVKIDLHIWS